MASQDEVDVIVDATNEYKIDAKYAAELQFIPAVGDKALVVAKQRLGKADAEYSKDGKSMRWSVAVTAKQKGEHPVDVKLKAQVCDEHACYNAVYDMRLKITVKGQ